MKTVKLATVLAVGMAVLACGLVFMACPADGGNDLQTIAVTGVSLNQTSKTIDIGEAFTLTATVQPADASNKNVSWSTSDAAKAAVADGVVTGVASTGGETVTITATTTDGGKTAVCTVTVTASVYFNVTLSGTAKWGEGRKLTANVDTVLEGTPSYAWTGAGTPNNLNEYEMVEDDENKTVTCTVTIGEESKSANVTVQPMYANLNAGWSNVVENRSESKTNDELLAEGVYTDISQMTAVKIISGTWNGSKTDNNISTKLASNPVNKFVIVENGSVRYESGKMLIPYSILFTDTNAGNRMTALNNAFLSVFSELTAFKAQKNDVWFAALTPNLIRFIAKG